MPLRTLSARIAAPAGFFTLVSVAALSVLQIRSQREQTLQEAIHGSENIAEIIQLSLHHEMAINRRDELTEMLISVGAQLDLETVRIYNKDGVISFSSRASEVGQAVDIASDACRACHQGSVPLGEIAHDNRSRVYVDASGERVLGTILVIENEEGCQGSGCHASTTDRSVLGIMDVTVSLAPHEARVAE